MLAALLDQFLTGFDTGHEAAAGQVAEGASHREIRDTLTFTRNRRKSERSAATALLIPLRA